MHPSARAAATWRTSEAGSIRGTVYRAFRAPTLNELHRNFRVGDSLTLANDQLVAETLTGGEVSWLWATSRYSVRATGFVTALDDAIANVTLTTTPTLITRQRQNAGSVSSRGVEVEGEWRLDRRWTVSGNVTATNSRRFGEGPSRARRAACAAGAELSGCRRRALRRSAVAHRVDAGARDWPPVRGRSQHAALDAAQIVDLFASRGVTRTLHVFGAVENLFDEVVPVGRTPLPTIGLPRTYRVGVRVFWP